MPRKKAETAPETPKGETFRVRATQRGFLDQRRREGDVFEVSENDYSDVWMEKVGKDTPLVSQSSADVSREAFGKYLAGTPTPKTLQSNSADPVDEKDDDDEPTGNANVLG